MATRQLTYRERHSDRARTMEELFLELEEWVNETTDDPLGYSLTFRWTDPGSGIERRYNLHDDSTRAAIELFVRRYREPGPVFVSASTGRTPSKPCVRFFGSSRANGFYNHSDDDGRESVPAPARRPRDEDTAPALAPRTAVGFAVRRRPAALEHATAPTDTTAATDTNDALDLLQRGAVRSKCLSSWQDWLAFRNESSHKSWVYYARFAPEVFAWGTASGDGQRLRKTSLFHPKLTGKYDRRVDYLMLKTIYGKPVVWVFEAADAVGLEAELRARVRNRYCFAGIQAQDRRGISKAILKTFMETSHWIRQSPEVQFLFVKFLDEIYFAGLSHPDDPKRTFHFGDSLEPGFIDRTLGRPELIPAIEAALRVQF